MHVIVCGAGLVGQGIVQYLASEEIDVVVIDEDPKSLERLEEMADVQTIVGSPCHPTSLETARAAEADLLVAVTPNDETNMIACQVAHSLFNVPMKIAHLREVDYLDPKWAALFSANHMPIDVIISPEQEVARSIQRSIEVPGAVEILPLSAEVYVVCTQCMPDSMLAHVPLSHFSALFPQLSLSVLGFVRDHRLVIPKLDDTFLPLDYVYFCVHREHVNGAMGAFGHEEANLKDVLILGGGNIGMYLAQILLKKEPHLTVRIIERCGERAKLLAQKLPNVLVLSGDGLDTGLLEEANIQNTQAVVAVTNDNEVNLLASLMAKRLGNARTLSVVNNPNYSSLVAPLGIDVVISPRSITVSSILRHVRRGGVRSAHTLLEDVGEIIEVDISENSPVCGDLVQNLNIPGRLQIGLIIRGQQAIFPEGKESIQTGDKLLLLVSLNAIAEIERFTASRTDYF